MEKKKNHTRAHAVSNHSLASFEPTPVFIAGSDPTRPALECGCNIRLARAWMLIVSDLRPQQLKLHCGE